MSVGHYDIGQQVAARALLKGARRPAVGVVEVNAAGRCERPIGFETHYRRGFDGLKDLPAASLTVRGDGRCRRCPECLKHRQRLWATRASAESSWAPRTWFGTLTVSPSEAQRHLEAARARARRGGFDLDLEPVDAQFRALVVELGVDLTKYIKRVREQVGSPLRYLFVVERHMGGGGKDGLPHLHCLIHEAELDTVKKAILRQQWPHGFTQWKLVDRNDRKAVWYVCKYLGKQTAARVRASFRYGRPALAIGTQERPVGDRPPLAAVVGARHRPGTFMAPQAGFGEAVTPHETLGQSALSCDVGASA